MGVRRGPTSGSWRVAWRRVNAVRGQAQHAVCPGCRRLGVRHQQAGRAAAPGLLEQQIQHAASGGRVQVAGGFVGQDQLRLLPAPYTNLNLPTILCVVLLVVCRSMSKSTLRAPLHTLTTIHTYTYSP